MTGFGCEISLSSQFLPSRLQLAHALLLASQLLTLLLDHFRPGPGNKGFVRELALNAHNLLLRLGNLLVETFQFFQYQASRPAAGRSPPDPPANSSPAPASAQSACATAASPC